MTLDRSRPALFQSAWFPPAVGLVFGGMALALTAVMSGPGGITAIWPANALVLVALIKAPRHRWLAILGFALAGYIATNLIVGNDPLRIALLGLGNVTEAWIAAALALRRGSLRLMRRSGLQRFAIAILAACVASTAIAFITLSVTGASLAPQGALLWFAADLLGLAVFAPALLAIVDGRVQVLFDARHRRDTIGLLALLVLVVSAVFYQSSFPLLFLPPAVVIFMAFRIGLGGASIGVLMVAVISIALSVSGRGPLMLMDATAETRVLILQVFLGVLMLIALVGGTVVAERKNLVDRMTAARARARSRSIEQSRYLEHARLAESLSLVGYWTFTPGTGEVYWSPEVYRIHGVTPETFDPNLGDALAFYVPQDRERVAEILAETVRTGIGWQFDARLSRASDGALRDIRSVSGCQLDDHGAVTTVYGVFKDLTDERRLIADVVEHEQRYRLLAENSTDIIATYDLDGTFTYLSPSIQDVLGYAPAELLGKRTYDVILPEDHATVVEKFTSGARSREPFSVEYRAVHKNGSQRWLEARPRFRKDAEGVVVGLTDTVRDVTHRREREAALAQARSAAEAATAAKAAFLATMSHEIRTPLNGILGFSEVLSETTLDAEQARYVARIRSAGDGLSTLIDDILDLSKIEAGKMVLESHAFSIADLVSDTLALTEIGLDKPLTFARTVAAGLRSPVVGDGARVRQVLLNLLSNAAKFTDAGSVRVVAGIMDDLVEIRVMDTGVGISPEALDGLFDSFTQADSTITRRFGGTGLGLSISRSLARMMGGDLRLESQSGAGTTAIFTFPHLPASQVAATPSIAETGSPTVPSPISVLVVDDVEMNRDLINTALAKRGHRITTAASGVEAIEQVENGGRFDLILMDVQMPGMDGLEATRRLRSQGGPAVTTPIFALTADVMPEQVAACLAAGMDGHIGKPIRLGELTTAVERSLSVARGLQERQAINGQVDDAIQAFRMAYVSDLMTFETSLGQMLEIEDETERLLAIATFAHTATGTAGMLGYDKVAKAAKDVEAAVKAIRSGAESDDLHPRVRTLIDSAQAALGQHEPLSHAATP